MFWIAELHSKHSIRATKYTHETFLVKNLLAGNLVRQPSNHS